MTEQLHQGAFDPEWMKSATERQRQAIVFDKGQLLVAAGPGSGKTRVITGRVRYLIEEKKIPPEQILTITFTRSAAAEMKHRAAAMCRAAQRAVFGTFHSVFYQILVSSGYYRGFRFLSPYEQKQILLKAEKLIPEEKQLYKDAERTLSAISRAKNTGELPPQTEEIYRAYLKECRLEKRLDFDDILLLCEDLLKRRREIRCFWQKRFSYIQIDEFQDINAVQFRIIKILAGEHKNLFVVGDDDQAIYSFRGASPAFMRTFQKDYPGAGRIDLDLNFRSDPRIVSLSGACIAHNTDRLEKHIRCAGQQEEPLEEAVVFRHFSSRTKETEAVKNELSKLPGMWSENHRVTAAVLCRTNAAMEQYAAAMAASGIPFFIREKRKMLYQEEVCRDYRAFLRFLYRGSKRADLFCFLDKIRGELPRSIFEEETVELERSMRCYPAFAKELEQLKERLSLARGLDHFGSFHFFYDTLGYRQCMKIRYGTQQEKLSENEKAAGEIAGMPGCDSAVSYLEVCTAYEKSFEETADAKEELPENKVILMTYHGAKGLEFDRVYLPGIVEGEVPKGRMPDTKELMEERRMFYVAMTRAKKLLYISSFGDHPSVFLEEMTQDI